MALTKIGATLGGSADVITVTQNSHGLLLGRPVKMTASGYAHATANTAANAESVGIVIASDWDGSSGANTTFTLALSGRITVDGCVPNETAGTVLFLQVSAGLLAATEPSNAGEISKPMAVVTVANSEMIMVQQRGEVISTGAAVIADGSITSAKITDGTIVNADVNASAAIDATKIADGSVTSAEFQYINSLTSNAQTQINAKAAVGSGTPSTQTIPDTAATGSSTEAARLDHVHTMPSVSGIPSGVILMWHGLIANIPSGWVLCNGSNSTPDLRGQFVQGAANGVEAGATGGSATAAPAAHSNHSVTQPSTHSALASHSHATNHGTWSTYRHGFARGGAGYGTSTSFTINARSTYNYIGVSTSAGGMLTQSVAAGTPNAHSGTAVNAHSAHSTSDSRPPFYTILYIMKT